MKKMFFIAVFIIATAASNYYGYQKLSEKSALSDIQMANVEALTEDEYTIGFPGTNWE